MNMFLESVATSNGSLNNSSGVGVEVQSNVAPASCCNSPVNSAVGVDIISTRGMRVAVLSMSRSSQLSVEIVQTEQRDGTFRPPAGQPWPQQEHRRSA